MAGKILVRFMAHFGQQLESPIFERGTGEFVVREQLLEIGTMGSKRVYTLYMVSEYDGRTHEISIYHTLKDNTIPWSARRKAHGVYVKENTSYFDKVWLCGKVEGLLQLD